MAVNYNTNQNFNTSVNTHNSDTNFTNANYFNAILQKYDNMIFNPLKYQLRDDETENNIPSHCNYLLPSDLKKYHSSDDDHFSLLNLNIRSLRKNFAKLQECLKVIDINFTVIGISETHLKSKPNQYYSIPGYGFEYTNRTNRSKGGVGLYISHSIDYKLREDLCKATCNFESCFIEIERKQQRNILVGVIYRAHTNKDDFINEINPIIDQIMAENKDTYIMGDFNIDLLKEEDERAIHDYLNMILSFNLIPSINKPTRITEKSATLIDNILTNNIDISSAILVTDISDHFLTATFSNERLNTRSVQKGYIYKRNYTNDNIDNLKEKLSKFNWSEVLHDHDVDEDYNTYLSILNNLVDECIPIRKHKINKKTEPLSPWITKGLLKSINIKNKLYKNYKNSPTGENLHKFKTYRNKLHNLLRNSKRSYYDVKFKQSVNNMKHTWKNINSLLGRNKQNLSHTHFKRDTGEYTSDPNLISNDFNDFFVNIGPNLASQIENENQNYSDFLFHPSNHTMFMQPVTENEILKIISKLDPNKSPGHDNINNHLIKKIANEICSPLTRLFNLSITKSVFPKDLKMAKVVPIYKKGDKELYSNYRPVSILPCFSKILERLIFNRVSSFIDKHNILNNKQFGFRPGYSTEMAIIDLMDKIHMASNIKKTTLAIYLDLSKAFDTINHDILLHKLEFYGFRGIVLDWFNSYLKERSQFVYYNNCKSCVKNISCGVPQGSILGPLLFLLYINDIANTSPILDFILFADDTTILYSHNDLANNINAVNTELKKVTNWFKSNKLSINTDKTNYMIMGTPQATFRYRSNTNVIMNGTCLTRVNKTKFLGLIIDENLSFKFHIEYIMNTISSNVGILHKLKYSVSKHILKYIYNSLIQPYISYGILTWGNTHNIYLDKIYKLQKRAVRNITKSDFKAHSNPLFKELGLLTVRDIYKVSVSTFMLKHQMNLLPPVFNSYFIMNKNLHGLNTRNMNNYHTARNMLTFTSKGIRTSGPLIWNNLHYDCKQINNIKRFKLHLKSQMLLLY